VRSRKADRADKKSRAASLNSSGASPFTPCPAPGMTTSRAPSICFRIDSATAVGARSSSWPLISRGRHRDGRQQGPEVRREEGPRHGGEPVGPDVMEHSQSLVEERLRRLFAVDGAKERRTPLLDGVQERVLHPSHPPLHLLGRKRPRPPGVRRDEEQAPDERRVIGMDDERVRRPERHATKVHLAESERFGEPSNHIRVVMEGESARRVVRAPTTQAVRCDDVELVRQAVELRAPLATVAQRPMEQ
jgi:hypothetical protein